MNKENKKVTNIFLRYLMLIILGSANLYIIYKILTPLTIYATNTLLGLFFPTELMGNVIHFHQSIIQIIPACVAGSAFYLLIALFLSLSDVNLETRTKAIFTAISTLFILNILRIVILSLMIKNPNFEMIHWIFWHIVSTILVVTIYILIIRFYKIKSIPGYSDFKYLKSLIKKHKKKKK